MSAVDYLAGRRVLAEVDSKINGKITVVKELIWGTYIMAGGLPQSGGLAKRIWQKSLKRVNRLPLVVNRVLILGFAGGGIAQIVRKLWPESEIYGVDIDPHMVELGRKYLDWESTGARVWIQDASSYIDDVLSKKKPRGKFVSGSRNSALDSQFDLVCVDMYAGAGVPAKFSTAKFARKVKKLLSDGGIAVFNRLYGTSDRGEAQEFKEKLEEVYSDITTVYPEANVMFICGD